MNRESTDDAADPSQAMNIGPYRILEELGRGGMGVVYLAEQTEPIRRRAALKVIKLGMDTKEVVARFEAERQALAMMNHPNIAAVYDGGATAEGRPYFVMEYVPGEPLTKYCDRHKLTMRERLDLFMIVCHAVQHAHQKGIIHRDIKPSNVLVAIQDDKPVPKVIDFGVAKATNQRLTERTVFTEQGRLIGTPEYMSPEQAEMGGLDIDTRTDIYSLGVLLYELLVGVLPFEPATLRQAGYAEVARIIREVEPQKPSTRFSMLGRETARPGGGNQEGGIEPPRATDQDPSSAHRPSSSPAASPPLRTQTADRLPPPIPALAAWVARPDLTPEAVAAVRRTDAKSLVRHLRGDLDWIVMKALDKDRTRRYASASEFATDVQHYLGCEPVKAGPPTMAYRARKFVRKHRTTVATSVGGVLVLATALVATSVLWVRADLAMKAEAKQRELAHEKATEAELNATDAQQQRAAALAAAAGARTEAERARREAAKAQRIQEFLESLFRSASPDTGSPADLKVRDVMDAGLERARNELRDDPDVRAAILHAVGRAYMALGDERAVEVLRAAVDLRSELANHAPTEESSAARLALADSLELLASAIARAEPSLATAVFDDTRSALGMLLGTENQRTRDFDIMAAIFAREESRDPITRDNALFLVLASYFNSQLGDTAFPEPAAGVAAETRRRWQAGGPQEAAAYLADRLFFYLDHLEEATARGDKVAAHELMESFYRPVLSKPFDSRDVPSGLRYVAEEAKLLGRHQAALALLQEALRTARELLPAEHPTTCGVLFRLGRCLSQRGDCQGAVTYLTEAMTMFRTLYGQDLAAYADGQMVLGGAQKCAGDLPGAEAAFRSALSTRERVMPDHWLRYNAMSYLGEAVLKQKRYEEAESLLVRACEGLHSIRATPPDRTRRAFDFVIRLYESWKKRDLEVAWRAKRDEWSATTQPSTRPAGSLVEPTSRGIQP